MINRTFCTKAIVAISILYISSPSIATEGGGSTYSHGTESAFVGYMPAPGFHFLIYSGHDRLTSYKDHQGKNVNTSFSVTANTLAPRAVWVTQYKVFGGDLAWHTVIPLLNIQAKINGQTERRQGLGDIVVGLGLGYHPTAKIHYAFGLDATIPTGSYHKKNLINLGRNYWNIQPAFAFSYIQNKGLNIDFKLMYDLNLKNRSTQYRSGQEMHIDYSIGYGIAKGLQLGIGGYAYKQTTPDKKYGNTLRNTKGQALAIGPAMTYHQNNFLLSLKLQKDYKVKNRAAGHALKIKLSIPI